MTGRNGIRVMICDDSAHVRDALQNALTAEGFTVVGSVDNFRELQTALLNGAGCDVILCDVYLSDLSGLEAPQALAELGVKAPVLLMSADHRLRAKAKRAGAAGFFVKGRFDLSNLVSELRTLAGESSARRSSTRHE